jgi:hypothetical protein
MRFSRKFRRSLHRLLLAGALAGAAWAPASALASNGVQPAARYDKSGDVYIGRAVPMPSTSYSPIVGTMKNSPAQPAATTQASSTAGFDWRAATIAIASVFAACVLLATAYVARRRMRLTPA